MSHESGQSNPDFFTPEAIAAREAAHDESNQKIGAGFHSVMAGLAPYLRKTEHGLEYIPPEEREQAKPQEPTSAPLKTEPPEPLFDVPASQKPRGRSLNPKQRRAAGAIPGIMALHPDERIPVDVKDYERLEPSNLRRMLWHNNPAQGDYVVDGVALTPLEYKTIVRSVRGLAQSIGATVLSAPKGVGLPEGEASRREAHAKTDALTDLAAKQALVADGMTKKAARLHRLVGYLRDPGMARTSEADIRELSAEAFGEFESILKVAGRQYGLNNDEQKSMYNSLLRALATGPQQNRIDMWTRMTLLAEQFTQRKQALFASRASAVTAELERIQAKNN